MFDDDLNIFYWGGSGGHFLFHNILINGRHNVVINHSELGTAYRKKIPEFAADLKFWKNEYDLLKGIDWPSYEEYIIKQIDKVNHNILNEISALENKSASNGYHLPGFMEHAIDYIITEQWKMKGANWKNREFWPDNRLTSQTTFYNKSNKLIFLTVNSIDNWLKLPGKKIVLYTDIHTCLRMAWYKKANWFAGGYLNLRPIAVQQIKNSVKFNDIKINTTTEQALKYADLSIYLQDIINCPDKYNFTSKVHKILHKKWLDNHGKKLLSKCNFKDIIC